MLKQTSLFLLLVLMHKGSSSSIEPVAFGAQRASDNSRKGGQKIMFDNTMSDVGYGWYADRSEFVCFYPGTYFFTFSALSLPSNQFKISLMKNKDEVVTAWGDKLGYHGGTNSIVLSLAKNDRVFLSLREGGIHETKHRGKGYTSFSGFRIA